MNKLLHIIISLILVITLICSGTLIASAKISDTKNWYEYNNSSTSHPFNIKFPSDWQVRTIDEQMQGFAPKNKYKESPILLLQEFMGQSYETVIDYYKDADTSLMSVTDILLSANNDELLGKKAVYQKKSSDNTVSVSIFKRGNSIVAILPQSDDYEEIFDAMIKSFYFSDGWHAYLDFNDGYTIIFPDKFELKTFDYGIEIIAKSSGSPVFTINKKENSSLSSISEKSKQIDFHDIENAAKELNKIFIERNGNLIVLTNNGQDSDYYNEYVQEMMESFEFLDVALEGNVDSYQNFSDVKDIHPNAKAINSLFKSKVIGGYEDGTFHPDAEISRAELTKMIVASKTTPDKSEYHDCFVDVKVEWFAPYICYAKSKGWTEGYGNGSFKPEAKISRAEAIKIILSGFFGKINSKEILKDQSVSDIKLEEWYAKYYIFADNRNLLDEQHVKKKADTYLYYPSANITRKEIAEMIYRIKNLNATKVPPWREQ